MCLILFSYKNHSKYPLVIAANRDEFYDRPTSPATYWAENDDLFAGRDKTAGGTWMGITKSGKISMLTNYRDPLNIRHNAPSRGHLVSDYLINDDDPGSYLRSVEANGSGYNGFNLICGTKEELQYYGNYQQGVHHVTSGIHGLSNALLNTSWPKVEKGKTQLQEVIKHENINPESLFELLYDDLPAPNDQLPETGVGLEMEKMLSPMFIKSANYGSRCSTVVLVDRDGNVQFLERTYDTSDFTFSTVRYNFRW